jgi:hypothetical protein
VNTSLAPLSKAVCNTFFVPIEQTSIISSTSFSMFGTPVGHPK